jgi:hypothetical protein
MRGHSKIIPAAVFVAVIAAIGVPVARAGLDVSFGANAPIDNDGRLFLSISSHYFDRDRPVVDRWSRRYTNPDDLSVFFWITQNSHRPPEYVDALRRQGYGWFEVGRRCGIPVDAWYVPVQRPGSRYGRSYGSWQRYQADPRYNVRLNDRDIRDLVAVRMAHEYYGVTPEVAMNWRRTGTSTRTIMTREYRSRHRNDDRDDQHRNDQNGNSHGSGNGNGHGHDKN